MSTVTEYTLSEMILLAAHKLNEKGQTPFSAEDLIVESWRQFPRAFGLKGYGEQHPDSNRVLSSIMGERGLARRGWLMKVGQKMYALSKEGNRVIRRMVEGVDDEPEEAAEPQAPRLPREQEKLLISLLDSTAMEKHSAQRGHELSFGDASRFWGITDNNGAEALDARLAMVESTISHAARSAAKGTLIVMSREVTPAELDALQELHDHLMERFARHLNLLRSRSVR